MLALSLIRILLGLGINNSENIEVTLIDKVVSIGYSSCHWCHVMEKETFEDQEVASLKDCFGSSSSLSWVTEV